MKQSPFTLAVAQTNPRIADLKYNRDVLLTRIDEARREGAKLFTTGELALTGYLLRDAAYEVALMENDPFLEPFKKASKDMILIITLVEESSDHRFYNSAFVYENGELIHRHRKVYLPNYGMFEEKRFFAEGDKIRAFDTNLGRFGVLVCNDMWHPMTALLLAYDGAEAIFASTASPTRGIGDGEVSNNTRVWRIFNRSAAKAASAYVIQANLAGFQDGVHFWGGSEVVQPGGASSVQAELNKEAMLYAEYDPELVRFERLYSPLLRDERLSLEHREFSRILKKGLP